MVQKNKNNQLKEIEEATKQEELVQKIQRKLTVLKIEEETEKIYGTIKFESTIENLEYVTTPEENKIELKKQTKEIAIDYELQNKQEYEFKVKAKDNAEEIIKIVVDKDIIPKIQITQDKYANITTKGVTLERKITMDQTAGFKTMYSLDNGNNWKQYTGEITTNQLVNSVIGKKVPINEEDVIITLEKYEKMPELAVDAIGIPSYDYNEGTTEVVDKDKYIKIEPEMKGFKIQVLSNKAHQIIFTKEDKITQIGTVTNNMGAIIVPEGARYLKVVKEKPLKDIREIKVLPSVKFDKTKDYIGQTKITIGVKAIGYSGSITYEYYIKKVNEANYTKKTETTQDTYQYTGLDPFGIYNVKVIAKDSKGNMDYTEKQIQTFPTNDSIIGYITSDGIDGKDEKGAIQTNYTKKINDETYGFEVIYLDKNNLPSQVQYNSSTNTYTISSSMNIGTAETNQMAVLKCDGNLTINNGVTITTSTYPVTTPTVGNVTKQKGLFICCMGTLTNNGTISQTERGTYNTVGQNVYLWKNGNTIEFVPKDGTNGGAGVNAKEKSVNGKNGEDAEEGSRKTGGGGSGSASGFSQRGARGISGSGSQGTSYSGGSGGGRC